MSYKIPALPSPKAYLEEKADFWEIQSILNSGQFISQMNITKSFAYGLDEMQHDGIESEEDTLEFNLESVYQELIDRRKSCYAGYPFEFGHASIKFNESREYKRDMYLYLLLCTRFNMNTQKMQNGIDATLLFEEICAEVARNHFGKNSECLIFGTATPGNFEAKIRDLAIKLGEGEGYKNPNQNYPTKNDDGIDVVVWKNFADFREGKLIGFAQCKTGTNWRDLIHKLKPRDFCDNWLVNNPVLSPIPMIFLCDTLHYEQNFITDQRGFLIFNRFRIMEYLPDRLDAGLYRKVQQWLQGALNSLAKN